MDNVVPFRPRKGPWHPWERQALVCLQGVLDAQGLLSSFTQGVEDNGTPWRAFYDGLTGKPTAYVLRGEHGYALRWADGSVVRAETLGQLLAVARSRIGSMPTEDMKSRKAR